MIRFASLLAILLFAPAAAAECHIQSMALNPTELSIRYESLVDHGDGGTESGENRLVVPTDMVASNLFAVIDVAPGGAANDDAWGITLRDDTADTSLTCDIVGLATTCSDTTNEPIVLSGSRVTMKVDPNAGTSQPDTSTIIHIYFCWSISL